MAKHEKSEKPPSSIGLLETFWRRYTFHDMEVEDIIPVNRRVIVRLYEYTLIVTDTSRFQKRELELPTAWLYESMKFEGGRLTLKVETDGGGEFEVAGRDIRLIRNRDWAILIPPVDK